MVIIILNKNISQKKNNLLVAHLQIKYVENLEANSP